jgi:hypothetical protein
MNKNILLCCLTLVSSATVAAQETQRAQHLMSDALTGKLAYLEGNYQIAHAPILAVLRERANRTLYLQYVKSALHQNTTDDLFSITNDLSNRSDDITYKKMNVALEVRYKTLPLCSDLDLLSKNDWYEFFSLLPPEDRIVFLEKIYQPAMVGSSSTRAFMAELLMMLDLHKEASLLLMMSTKHLNADLIDTGQKILSIQDQRKFLIEYQFVVPSEDRQLWLEALAAVYQHTAIPPSLVQCFLKDTQSPEVIKSLIEGRQFELATTLVHQVSLSGAQQQLFLIKLQLERFELKEAEQSLKQYHPKSLDGYKMILADYHYKKHEYEKALNDLEFIEDSAVAKEALLLRTKILLKIDPKAALMVLSHLQQRGLYPKRDLCFLQAIALSSMGHQPQAITLLERIHQDEPQDLKIIVLLAELYLHYEKKPIVARDFLLKHTDGLAMTHARGVMVLAESYAMLGCAAEATTLAKKAVELRPSEDQLQRAKNLYEQLEDKVKSATRIDKTN